MSGPRGGLGLGLAVLSGEMEPDERSEDSDEALLSLSYKIARQNQFKLCQLCC